MPTTPNSDGYVPGQRDRALVLNFFGRWDAGEDKLNLAWHAAMQVTSAAGDRACEALVADGLLQPDWLDRDVGDMLTDAGRAAHAAAERALADLDAKIAALPETAPMPAGPVAFAIRGKAA